MKKVSLSVLGLVLFYISFPQNPDHSALHKLPAQKKDTQEVQLLLLLSKATNKPEQLERLINICYYYREHQRYSEALTYTLEVLKIREEQNDKKGIEKVYGYLGDLYAQLPDTPAAMLYWSKALKLMQELHDPTVINIWQNFGLANFTHSKSDSSLYYFQLAYKASKDFAVKEMEAKSLMYIGRNYLFMHRLPESMDTLQLALELFKRLKQPDNIASVLNGIGNVYIELGNHGKAIDSYLESLTISNAINVPELIASNLNDLTGALESVDEDSIALDYLFKAKKTFEKQGNHKVMPVLLGNLGATYVKRKDYVRALQYILESLRTSKEPGVFSNTVPSLINLGLIYCVTKKYPQSLNAAFESLKLIERSDDKKLIAKNYTLLGKIYLEMTDDSSRKKWPDSLRFLSKTELLQRAMVYIDKSLEICKATHNNFLLQENYHLKSEVQAKNLAYGDALTDLKLYASFRDSIYNSKNEKQVARKLLEYEFNQRAAEKDKQMAVFEEAHKATLRIWSITGGAILLLGVLVFYFNRKIENGKYNIQIAKVRQQVLLNQVSEHFMGNAMISIDRFINNNDKESASKYLMTFLQLFSFSLKNASKELVYLRDDLELLKDYLALEKIQYTLAPLQYEIYVDEDIDIDNTMIPPMIFQVLAENAIVHAFNKTTGGKIWIRILKQGNRIEGSVEDNGIGRVAAQQLKAKENPGIPKKRSSMGGRLAEELVKTASKNRNKTSFEIIDLYDTGNKPTGTLVKFTLPYLKID